MKTDLNEKIRIRDSSGKIKGPFTRAEVLAFIRKKKLSGEEEIFLEGEGRWKDIGADTEFFDLIQEMLFGIKAQKTGIVSKKEDSENEKWEESFEKESSQIDKTEKIATLLSKQSRIVTTKISLEKELDKEKTKTHVGLPSKEPKEKVQIKDVEIKGFEDLAPAQEDSRKKKRSLLLLFSVLALSFAAFELFLGGGAQGIDLKKVQFSFSFNKDYFRPLLLRTRLLPDLKEIPAKADMDLDDLKVLPLNIHDALMLLDESKNSGLEYQSAANAFLRVWTYTLLSDLLSAANIENAQKYRELAAYLQKDLAQKISLRDSERQSLKALNLFLGGDFEKSIVELQAVKLHSPASLFLLREIQYWDSLDLGEMKKSDEMSPVDLGEYPLKQLFEERLRRSYTAVGFDEDFLSGAEKVFEYDSRSLVTWLLLGRYYEQNFKANLQIANRYYFTGLSLLSLYPRVLQGIYWRYYGGFFVNLGNFSFDLFQKTAESIETGVFDKSEGLLDLNHEVFKIDMLLEAYRKAFENNEMGIVELASFEVLSEASSKAQENLAAVIMAPLLDKNWFLADKRLKLVEKTFPFDLDIKILRIWYEGERFRFEEAQKVLTAAFAPAVGGTPSPQLIKAEGILYTLGRDYEQGRALLRQYIRHSPQDALTHYFIARAAFESEKYTDCVKAAQLAQLNSVGPLKLRSQLMGYRCRVKASLGVEDALRDFGNFVARLSHTSISREEYVRALLDADRSQEALKFAEEDVRNHPKSTSLKILLGEVYEKRGESNDALLMYNEARRLDPKNPKPSIYVANLFFKEERYLEAAQNYVAAGAQDLDLPELFLKAARSYRKAGDLVKAKEMYFKEVELRPAVLEIFLEASEFLLETNLPSEVPGLFAKFSENFRSDARVLTRLAQSYVAIGDYNNARVNAELAARLQPTEAEPYRVLGVLFEQLGQYHLAKANYEKYLVLLPQAPEARQLKMKLQLPPFSAQ